MYNSVEISEPMFYSFLHKFEFLKMLCLYPVNDFFIADRFLKNSINSVQILSFSGQAGLWIKLVTSLGSQVWNNTSVYYLKSRRIRFYRQFKPLSCIYFNMLPTIFFNTAFGKCLVGLAAAWSESPWSFSVIEVIWMENSIWRDSRHP